MIDKELSDLILIKEYNPPTIEIIPFNPEMGICTASEGNTIDPIGDGGDIPIG